MLEIGYQEFGWKFVFDLSYGTRMFPSPIFNFLGNMLQQGGAMLQIGSVTNPAAVSSSYSLFLSLSLFVCNQPCCLVQISSFLVVLLLLFLVVQVSILSRLFVLLFFVVQLNILSR